VLLFDRTFVSGSLPAAIRRSWALYSSLACTWVLLGFLSLNQPHFGSAGFGLVPFEHWWLTQSKIFWTYMKLAIWPSPLMIHYLPPYLTTIAGAWIYVLPLFILAAVTLVLLWRNRPLGFVLTCIFAILAPTSLVPIPLEIAAERRMYLPLALIVATIVVAGYWVLQQRLERTPTSLAFASFVLPVAVVLGLASAHRLADYESETRLWQAVLSSRPDDFIAHEELGSFLVLNGRVPEGIEHIQMAFALKPDNPDVLNSLGFALMNSGQVAEALEKLHAAVALKPNFPRALNNYGATLGMAGRIPESIEPLQRALQLAPGLTDARVNLGNAYLQMGQLPEAVDQLQIALESKPDDLPTRYNLALAQVRLNREPEAITNFEYVLKSDPHNANAHFQLAQLFRRTGRQQAAIEHYKAVIRLKPNDVMAHAFLAQTFADANQPAEAIAKAEKAIDLAAAAGQGSAGKQIGEWLAKYKASLHAPGNNGLSSPASSTKP
jgi:tetratricopeptide (TPR) repeat protein